MMIRLTKCLCFLSQVQALEGAALSEAIMSFKAGKVGNTLDRQPRVTTGGKSGGLVVSYKDAGVDIDLGNALVERIKPACKVNQHRLHLVYIPPPPPQQPSPFGGIYLVFFATALPL